MKKAIEYDFMFPIVVIIIITTGILTMNNKIDDYSERVGSTQFTLMKTYEEGEKALYYIDSCFDKALEKALNDTLSQGSDLGCGTSDLGNPVWNPECYPTEADVESSIRSKFMVYLPLCLSSYKSPIPMMSYELVLSPHDGLSVSGNARNYLRTEIVDEGHTFEEDTSGLYVGPRTAELSIIPPIDEASIVPAGCFMEPRSHADGRHHGVDFAAPEGTPVKAAADGLVVVKEYTSTPYDPGYDSWQEYGNRIILEHEVDGVKFYTVYAHLSEMYVDAVDFDDPQEVSQGDIIGAVGTTGSSDGYHLHFEIRLTGPEWSNAVNPMCLIDGFLEGFTHSCQISADRKNCDFHGGNLVSSFVSDLDLQQSGECGDMVIDIAMQGLGHLYEMGARPWSVESDPPPEGKTDCGAFTQWTYGRFAYLQGYPDYRIQEAYPTIADWEDCTAGRNACTQALQVGRVVDHDPTDWRNADSIRPDYDKLQKGDLIFFHGTYPYLEGPKKGQPVEISHVAIYIGEGQYDEGTFIHAGSPVGYADLRTDVREEQYIGAKRLCPDESSAMSASRITGFAVLEDIELEDTDYGEHYLENMTCSMMRGYHCKETESCTGRTVMLHDGECCYLGRCVDTFAAHEIPVYSDEHKNTTPTQDKDDNVKVEDYSDKVVIQVGDEYVEIDVRQFGISIIAVISLISLIIYLIRRSKLIVISMMSLILLVLMMAPLNAQLQFSDLNPSQKELCRIANEYGIPGDMMLGLVQQESSGTHFRPDGRTVKVSDDGGVGLMQIDRGFDFNQQTLPPGPLRCCSLTSPDSACLRSRLDDHLLDIKDLSDNIECGLQILEGKCGFPAALSGQDVDCDHGTVHYCCPSDHPSNVRWDGIPFPISRTDCPEPNQYHAELSGIDIALRGYNGWACGPYEANRLYVELLHEHSQQFAEACPSDTDYEYPGQEEPQKRAGIPEEILRGAPGFYYMNPSTMAHIDFDIGRIDFAGRRAQSFMQDIEECAKDHELDVCVYDTNQIYRFDIYQCGDDECFVADYLDITYMISGYELEFALDVSSIPRS